MGIVKRISLINLFVLFFLFLSQTGFGQEYYIIGGDNSHLKEEGWMSSLDKNILKSMKLSYEKPEEFKEAYLGASECFKSNPKLSRMFTCINNKLYTEEEDYITFMPIYRMLTPEEVSQFDKMFPNINHGNDHAHINQIRNMIKRWYGDHAGETWEDYVTYYPTEEAQRKFNADTVITFSIELNTTEYYNDRYKYIDVLFIHKKGRRYVYLISFYDEKGKKNLAKYREAVEGILRYED